MQRKSAQELLPRDCGRYIFAYCHIRTKQVVYSLTRTLNNYSALKQLPDLGANNKDAFLRRDLWKPLYTLCLPENTDSQSQGIAAFRKLREWRKLHELNWEPTENMKHRFPTEQHLEKLQDRLDDRGSSKKETPRDLIKRAQKNRRIRIVQNQKANAVADLAAVLFEQEEVGKSMLEKQAQTSHKERKGEIAHMLSMSEHARQGGIERVAGQILTLERRLEKVLVGEEDEEGLSRTRLRRSIQALEMKRARMEFALRAVAQANAGELLIHPYQKEMAALQPRLVDEDMAEALARIEEGQESPELEEKMESVFASERQLLSGPRATRARALRDSAILAAMGKLADTSTLIEEMEQDASRIRPNGKLEPGSRAKLDELKIVERHMQVAANAVAMNPETNMLAEVDEVLRELLQYKIKLAAQSESDAIWAKDDAAVIESARRELAEARSALQELQATSKTNAEDEASSSDLTLQPNPLYKASEQLAEEAATKAATKAAAEQSTPAQAEAAEVIDWDALLPHFPTRTRQAVSKGKTRKLATTSKLLTAPVFSTEGVTIKWNNLLDAEFAEYWPSNVQHERMGWSRHVAPDPKAEPVDDAGEFTQKMGARSPKGIWKGAVAKNGKNGTLLNWVEERKRQQEKRREAERLAQGLGAEEPEQRPFVEAFKAKILGGVAVRDAAKVRKRERSLERNRAGLVERKVELARERRGVEAVEV